MDLLSRNDPLLEDAVNIDGWGMVVFEEPKDKLVLASIYLRENDKEHYRLKFVGCICPAKVPDYLQKEIHSLKIPVHPDCYMGSKEPSCERCSYNSHKMFSEPDFLGDPNENKC